MLVGSIIPQVFSDGDKMIYSAVFLQGCNFWCPYCQNPELKDPSGGREMTTGQIIDELLKDNFLVDGVLISGGEPTMQGWALMTLVNELRARNMKVVLNTNGSMPQFLECLAKDIKVTLDVKMPFHKYNKISKGVQGKIEESMRLLKKFDESEIRITWSPSFLSTADLVSILKWIKLTLGKEVPTIYLQRFQDPGKSKAPAWWAMPTRGQAEGMAKALSSLTGLVIKIR